MNCIYCTENLYNKPSWTYSSWPIGKYITYFDGDDGVDLFVFGDDGNWYEKSHCLPHMRKEKVLNCANCKTLIAKLQSQ